MSKPEFKPIMVKVSELHEYPGNPNMQDPAIFNNLVAQIEKVGWTDPLLIVPRPGASGYFVVSGNHRLRAAKVLDYDEVPCVIKEDWDDETAKIELIRVNNIRGENDPSKFTKLVDSFNNKYTSEELAEKMGFTDLVDFEKLYLKEEEEYQAKLKEDLADTRSEVNLVDGLSLILNKMFAEWGDSVPHSFIFLLYGSKPHVVVQANTKLKKLMQMIMERCMKDSLDINLVLTGLLGLGAKASNFEEGPPEREAIENEALEGKDEEYEMKSVTRG